MEAQSGVTGSERDDSAQMTTLVHPALEPAPPVKPRAGGFRPFPTASVAVPASAARIARTT